MGEPEKAVGRDWDPTTTWEELTEAKVSQAIGIMEELGIDVWITFLQEMGDGGDPVYPMIFGERDMGDGFLMICRNGERVAVAGGLDVAIPKSTATWTRVIEHRGWGPVMIDLLREFDPAGIAINYSKRFRIADGLSHGNYLRLTEVLNGTPYLERLMSAEKLIERLRCRKLPIEVELIRAAIQQTDDIFAKLHDYLRPGITGREIYDWILAEVDRRGLKTAWSRDHCPIVTVGPVAPIGHTPPGDTRLERGWTLQVDFGVKKDGYCSDFQRMWYVLDKGETRPPAEVTRLFDVIRRGIDTIVANLGPGAPTWQCAEPARRVLEDAGFPPYKYSLGHQLGRMAHDGGPGLGPRREGQEERLLEPGYVITAEGLETLLAGRGWISLEEDVLITETGVDVLTTRQDEMWLIG